MSNSSPSINRGWYIFDLSSIPSSAIIKSASFNLFVWFNLANYVDIDYYVRRCTDTTWTSASLTYNNAPNASVVSTIIGTLNSQNSGNALPISLTVSSVQSALSTGKLSLQVRSSDESDSTSYLDCYRSTYGASYTNTHLVITYYTGTELHQGEYAQMEIH